ncbi:hypothetical protein E3N88_28532 [Mikania micrantha]|uniref:ARID domain-containing protein n=1 Tax=Mikania micrantha TaxID=192012 RepID=A0A5N6N0A4_9ASTR|nr:hypothetical protein E3N88_28532 [Mikania micrantha]
MEATNTPCWCAAKHQKPGQQWHQSQRRTKAATKGVFVIRVSVVLPVFKDVTGCSRETKFRAQSRGVIQSQVKAIIQGFAKLRLGNGRRPCNMAVTRGLKQGKVQKSREIVNKALGYVKRRRLNPYRRLKRARCFTCKECGHVFTSCPNKAVGNHVDSLFVLDNENEFVVVGTENMGWDDIWYVSFKVKFMGEKCEIHYMFDHGAKTKDIDLNKVTHESLDQEMVIESKENKLNSYLDGHYEYLFNKMMNFKGIEDVKGKEKISKCVKVNSLSSMVEFLDSLENNKETFKVCFDNMLKCFYKKQLRLEEELDLPPNLDGYDIEMMHFYLIVKYMGGYEKVTKEKRWLVVVDRMGLLVYMVRRVELCYMKYFGILDSYYKTMKDEGVGTSKTIKEGIEAVVTMGQFGSKIKNERKWVRRNVSAFRSWPYICGPSYVNDGSKNFSKELIDDEFEDCEKESIGDNETDSRMEADYKDGLKTAGAYLKGAGTDPKDADAEPDAAETSLKTGKIETNTAGALAHAGADMESKKAGKEAEFENGDSEDSSSDDFIIITNKDRRGLLKA